MHDDYSDMDCIIFFCVMIRASLFQELGLLDEIYTPGGGEDIDFSAKAQLAGYKIAAVTDSVYTANAGTNVGGFPIWHRDNQTFRHIPEYASHIIKRNGLINAKRYNHNIRLNLGSGGVAYPGYLSVDLYDNRAHVQMDITKLDFDDNSAVEILASHLFEHLNPYHSIEILQEWLRVLKPGGKLIMEMPDIEALCAAFSAADTGLRYGLLNAIYGSVNTTDEGGPDKITSPHLFGWWPQSISDHLHNAGFENITIMPEQIPHPAHNFRVEATKPQVGPVMVKITGTVIDHNRLRQEEGEIYHELFEQNNYDVQTQEIQGRTVVDIGANVGLFSLLCVEQGAHRVIAVEAQPTVYNLGLKNYTQHFPQIETVNLAAYDSDDQTVSIPNNHVGSQVGSAEGESVGTVTLPTLLNRFQVQGNDLVLKLDCEGCEFNVLFSTPQEVLRRFSTIYMEVHGGINPNPMCKDVQVLRSLLQSRGFQCQRSVQMLSFEPGKPPQPMDVYVEKYSRI
jgi:FkbM family methyltransferase